MTGITVFNAQNCGIHQSGITVLCFRNDGSESSGILIEYYEDHKLDKAEILRLVTCQYMVDKHHMILKGASGNGKTYLACALGHAACRKFRSVKHIRMPELLDELNESLRYL